MRGGMRGGEGEGSYGHDTRKNTRWYFIHKDTTSRCIQRLQGWPYSPKVIAQKTSQNISTCTD